MVHELYKTLVIEYKLVSHTEFMNLENWEAQLLCNNLKYTNKDLYVIGRFIAYITAQVQCTKKLKLQDIMKLPWDSEGQQEELPKEISNEDIKRLKLKAKQIENKIVE